MLELSRVNNPRFIKGPGFLPTLKLTAMAAVLSLTAATLEATSPTEFDVSGNTITFNFPDWYQVQNSTSFESLCEGNAPCTVPNGTYFVINHSLMERFSVTIDTDTAEAERNEVISLPDDGWYQVQNAVTFESICEGVTTCTLEPGRYIVINHSTGERRETTIPTRTTSVTEPSAPTVPGSNAFPPYSDFKIDEGTITFTAPGWFQVQRQYDYETVCEGFDPCELPGNGIYQVINFGSGELWTNVFIGQDHSRAQCLLQGGQVIGDPGDGSVHQPEYRCSSGQSPAFTIFPLAGELVAEEGEVCCI